MKECPVCKKDSWDYDVIDCSTGATFCNGCYHDVKQYGHDNGLMKYRAGYGFIFKSKKSLCQAIKAVAR